MNKKLPVAQTMSLSSFGPISCMIPPLLMLSPPLHGGGPSSLVSFVVITSSSLFSGRHGDGGCLAAISCCWVPQWCPVIVVWSSLSLHPLPPCKQLLAAAVVGPVSCCPVSIILLLPAVLTIILVPSRHLPCGFLWSWLLLASSSIP
jgi:hypothetical protein